MGWGSAGDIFDPVAQDLIGRVPDEVLDRVCFRLAKQLMEGDWDTDDASIEQFQGVPVVQHAIRKARGWLKLQDSSTWKTTGRLEFRAEEVPHRQWWLFDEDGDDMASLPGTVAGFNRAIEIWAQDCGGTADDYLLI